MWRRIFRSRLPSNSASWRCESEAFVWDVPQSLRAEDVKTELSCEICLKVWKLKMWKRSFPARHPSKSERSRCENEAFVRNFPQSLQAEDVKTKLSCATSLQVWKLKMWKQSFRARPSLKIWTLKLKMWKRSFGARLPSESAIWRRESEAFVHDVPQNITVEDVKTKFSCETSFRVCKLKMWRRTFRSTLLSESASWRCENGPFVRDFLQSLKAEDVKTKLSCETSLKVWKLKMWKWSFRARRPSKSESWRCESQAFVREVSQNLNVEDVKTKLSCKTSFKVWKLKMWKRSFPARHPSKSERWRCENEAFVQDFLQSLQAENVKAKLSCETSLKI